MSNKEKCIAIIEELPDYKLSHILSFLQGFALDDDIEDDLYCQNLYRDYLADSDPDKHETVSLTEAMKECEVDPATWRQAE